MLLVISSLVSSILESSSARLFNWFQQIAIKANPDKCHLLLSTSKLANINSHFNYCPLLWMFHDRGFNSKINSTLERSLTIVYGDNKSSFEKLLRKDKSVKIHHKKLASSCYRNLQGKTWVITPYNKQCL